MLIITGPRQQQFSAVLFEKHLLQNIAYYFTLKLVFFQINFALKKKEMNLVWGSCAD